jgi:hypothetical protein
MAARACCVSAYASARDRNPASLPVIAARLFRRSRVARASRVIPRSRFMPRFTTSARRTGRLYYQGKECKRVQQAYIQGVLYSIVLGLAYSERVERLTGNTILKEN